MKRSGFKRKVPPRVVAEVESSAAEHFGRVHSLATPQRGVMSVVQKFVAPQEPEVFLRSLTYLRWVASLDCMLCGLVGYSQAAHADEGKGMGIKACDSTAFPLCADRMMQLGCHSMVGTFAAFTCEQRRELERKLGAQTRTLAKASNRWPKGWPA